MWSDVEGLLEIGGRRSPPPEHPRHEDQVPRAGDRRELRRPARAEDDRLEDAHTVLPSGKVRLMLAVDRHRNGEGRAGDESSGPRTATESVANADANASASASVGETSRTSPTRPGLGWRRLRRRRRRPPGRRRAPRSLRPPPPCGRRLPRRWRSRRPGHRVAHRPPTRPVSRPPACRPRRGGRTRARTGQSEPGDDLARREVRDHDPARGAAGSRIAPGGAKRDGSVTTSRTVSVRTEPRGTCATAATTAIEGTAVRARQVEPVCVGPHHERCRHRARDGCGEQDEGRSRQLPTEEHGRDRRRAPGAAQ